MERGLTGAGPSGVVGGRWPALLDVVLRFAVETPAAILVVTEIVVLASGVIARYLVGRPLIWADELAGILFLWLSMLGAASAFPRSDHMRMTLFVGAAHPRL